MGHRTFAEMEVSAHDPVMVTSRPRLHPDEVSVSDDLAYRLVVEQAPQWADLPLRRITTQGTDNHIVRIGEDLAARFPRIGWAAANVEREVRWLPHLAPYLPARVPVPVFAGVASAGYPWRWTVCPWLHGENPVRCGDDAGFAADIAAFVAALHAIDVSGGPIALRGVPLLGRDGKTIAAIEASEGAIDDARTRAAWAAALAVGAWENQPVWVHGDLSPGNLVCADDRLVGVIDFGAFGVGDPACDLIVAWNLLSRAGRQVFRESLGVDDATWLRGQGWALSVALIQLPYYRRSRPTIAAAARRVIAEVLAAGDLER